MRRTGGFLENRALRVNAVTHQINQQKQRFENMV
jgi:hypothetical protein